MHHPWLASLIRPSSAAPPGPTGGLLPRRGLAPAWSLIALITVIAWVLTVGQAEDMGTGPGTMGLALPLFLLLWLTMTAGMMLPSATPVALTWARAIGRCCGDWARTARTLVFVCGYLLAWTVFGLLAYVGLALTGSLLDYRPDAARWIASAVYLLAGLYQLAPLKTLCLRHCRAPMRHLIRRERSRPPVRDLRVGVRHGTYCVGCCAGLMAVLIPLGVMNLGAMAGLTVVIFLEKLAPWGPLLARAVGVLFLVLAALAPFHPVLLPGLQSPMPAMTGM
ncbi:DUF2182 domain-containing protein [Streptomyces olivochromogenes]|uniref:DUF2182 domain-containing protein n=1 Tax=Streptomyces olivochromogenes TaxID=1963 RepID=UPI001F1FD828|nr:DUF2182 domain-containing protein [Streptomyces olivochromogenes]MCF3129701.1 DUF2182 domain-containing protein [Streptomyces olivochromogenes]